MSAVLSELPRLRLGTIDSFFAMVTACFPMELGLPLGSVIMAEDETRRVSATVIDGMIARIYRSEDREAAQLILEAFKQGTFGEEEKRIVDTLQSWLKRGHEYMHDCPQAGSWGRPAAIWPPGLYASHPIWAAPAAPMSEVLARLVAEFDVSCFKDHRPVKAWKQIQEQVGSIAFGQKLPTQLATWLEKVEPILDDLRHGEGALCYHSSDWEFAGASAEAALDLYNKVVASEWMTRCQRTEGIRRILDVYESEYARSVRDRGRLSFADLPRLLSASQVDGAGLEADALWYRLDGRTKHWLFDEFQDTSVLQWRIMNRLVDEVLQDVEMERSFFAVGDVKQSIYGFRKAEAQLFGKVLRDYPDEPPTGIQKISLAQSYRSSQAVLDLVNGVFADRSRLATMLEPAALEHWEFEAHSAAKMELKGVGALLQLAAPDDDEAIKPADQVAAVTSALLLEIRPIERNLTCAVLLPTNPKVRAMVEHLRATTGFDIASQSEEYPAADNPANAALLAILQLAAHPGDTLALEHLRMTPLAAHFASDAQVAACIDQTLSLLHDDGFATVLDHWSDLVPLPWDDFTQRRIGRLVDMAGEFDAGGSRSVDEFLGFVRGYGLRTSATRRSIQVMTVHKAKGLEFDVVIVPLADVSALKEVKMEGLVMHRDGLEDPRWAIQMPTKAFVDLDPVMSVQKHRMEAQAAFESLCSLYVAMTRAIHGLYVVTSRQKPTSKTNNVQRLLHETLPIREESAVVQGCAVEWLRVCGIREWYQDCPIVVQPLAVMPLVMPSALGDVLREHQAMARRRTPSGEESFTVTGRTVFSQGRESGRHLGTLVHEMLEQVVWLDDLFSRSAIEQRWDRLNLAARDQYATARAMVDQVLGSFDCLPAFTPLSSYSVVWRERAFDVVLDNGDWISGTLDRVNINRNKQGKITAATIIDYKTDDVPDADALRAKLEGYAPQIALYRQAVSRLTGLMESEIQAFLLFTRLKRLVAL
jgi:ATP-dependent helicase/nuclease subunit A